jgi:Helix-turn-helix domain
MGTQGFHCQRLRHRQPQSPRTEMALARFGTELECVNLSSGYVGWLTGEYFRPTALTTRLYELTAPKKNPPLKYIRLTGQTCRVFQPVCTFLRPMLFYIDVPTDLITTAEPNAKRLATETSYPPAVNNEAIAQMFQAFAALPMLVRLIQKQTSEISEIKKELTAFRASQNPPSDQPEGYLDPNTLAAMKYLTVKQAAFLLNMSVKSVRRLIERGLLKPSKGLRVKLIPVGDIHAYNANAS